MQTNVEKMTIDLGQGKVVEIETGKLAWLAHGSVTVKMGGTVVLVTACHSDPRPGIDFFPLQVEYREKFSAAGRIPGGFFKREGRPSEKEILTARMTDRPLRPLFPEGYRDEVQVSALLLSADLENDSDVLSILGASVALMISDIPWNGPIGACRVGRIDGQFVVNPTHAEMEKSDLDLVYAGLEDKTIMIEGGCDELTEEELRDALTFANEVVKKQIAAIREFAAKVGKPKYEPELILPDESVLKLVQEKAEEDFNQIDTIQSKADREKALNEVLEKLSESLLPQLIDEERDEEAAKDELKRCFEYAYKKHVRASLLAGKPRMDGRGERDLRPLSAEVGVLPRTHGSALFSRGETQALVITTLGSAKDVQEYDGITGGETEKSFMLHYNFPPFSVGECGRYGSPGRREIGHGALAERSLARMMPSPEEFPYVVRCVSEIMTSNGSTSMASICGGSLSLMDAGVPLKKAVAGISCGLVTDPESGRYLLLTDIIGAEDHYGDMDFKVAGTRDGVTGFQLDLKIAGIPIEMMYEAMVRDREARLK
ncbi:MAG: polyribonucleotide nucleotidyltransferase, partial [Lentisphaerae bacterium]